MFRCDAAYGHGEAYGREQEGDAQLIGFDETSQFLSILTEMETDWIALDYWSELKPFDEKKNTLTKVNPWQGYTY